MAEAGEEDKQRLLDMASPGLDRILLRVLIDTGLRLEDLIDVRVSDLDLQKGSVRLPSSGHEIRLSPMVLSEMRDYLSLRPGQVYLFEGRCGKPVTAKWKRCVLDKIIQKAAAKDGDKR
ncbi:MAG TPA: site-specific integrase [Methanotrichaceae archaeon]|nr:site-specific integrase [Methanotrichaceae archaeon]